MIVTTHGECGGSTTGANTGHFTTKTFFYFFLPYFGMRACARSLCVYIKQSAFKGVYALCAICALKRSACLYCRIVVW
ncbi:MAG: hypothetical protein OXC30_05070 [Alphaproteobacteria bacterium]|nr:hypothetical protein [Alphaproteobacteria bacterium]